MNQHLVSHHPTPDINAVTLTTAQFQAILRHVGAPGAARTIPITDAMHAWERWGKMHLKKNTRDSYRFFFSKLIEHSRIPSINALTRGMIEAWKLHLLENGAQKDRPRPWNPRSVNNAVRMARHVFHWMTDYFEIDIPDPFEKVKGIRTPRKEYRFVTADEIDRLLEAAKGCRGRRETDAMEGWNVWASILLGAYAGLRKSEIVHCRWEWFDWAAGANGMLRVRPIVIDGELVWEPKSAASAGNVPIHPKLREALFPHLRRDGWVIAPEKEITSDYRYRYDGKKAFRRACEKADLPWVTMHVLRHSVASLMAEQGFSPIQISLMLRHQDTRCVSIYAHPRSESLDISQLNL